MVTFGTSTTMNEDVSYTVSHNSVAYPERFDGDPDLYQPKMWDPDPHQIVLDPPHGCKGGLYIYVYTLASYF